MTAKELADWNNEMMQVFERGDRAIALAILLASALMLAQQPVQAQEQPQMQRQDQQQQEWMAVQKACGQLGPVLRPQELSDQERNLVTKVFQRIIVPARSVGPYTTLGVVNSDVINAFTFPMPNQKGGFICLTRGLINLIDNEDELAFVTAHEAGHALDRQSPCPYNRNRASGVSEKTGIGSILGGGSATPSIEAQRICEKRADEIGFNLLVQGGYSPYAVGGAFGRLEMFSGDTSTGFFHRFAMMSNNHPITPDRIAEMSRMLANYCQRNPGKCQ